jgi:hypothetical protein
MKMFKWNGVKSGMFNVAMVRNFEMKRIDSGLVEVVAWFSDKETLSLGKFPTKEDAEKYLKEVSQWNEN